MLPSQQFGYNLLTGSDSFYMDGVDVADESGSEAISDFPDNDIPDNLKGKWWAVRPMDVADDRLDAGG